MLLFYIRHGQPIYNPDSLTELGKKQANALSKRLALYGIDEIYSSSSMRSRQTAQPTAEFLHLPIHILDWCNESYAYSEFTRIDPIDGKMKWLYQVEDVKQRFVSHEVAAAGKQWYELTDFADKQIRSGIERISHNTYAFLSSLGYEHNDNSNTYNAVKPNEKRIALFAHEGFGMAFLSALLDIPYPMFCTHFGLEHSGMTVIRFEGDKIVIPHTLQLSNDSHLYKEGLSTGYNGEIYF